MKALAPLLSLLLAAAASAQDLTFDMANTINRIGSGAQGMQNVQGVCAGGCAPADGPASRFAATLAGGFWGNGRGEAAIVTAASGRVVPLNLGFQALGRTGATGRISGPGLLGMGDGVYTVVRNEPYAVSIRVKTGFIDGIFALRRHPETGADAIGFSGSVMENGGWADRSGSNPGRITYDAERDAGTVEWMVNGRRQADRYERGGRDSRAMRITLNGHNHDFFQE